MLIMEEVLSVLEAQNILQWLPDLDPNLEPSYHRFCHGTSMVTRSILASIVAIFLLTCAVSQICCHTK